MIDQFGRTHKDKGDQWQDSAPLTGTTNSDGAYCGFKDQLEFAEQQRWNGTDWLSKNTSVQGILQIANDT